LVAASLFAQNLSIELQRIEAGRLAFLARKARELYELQEESFGRLKVLSQSE